MSDDSFGFAPPPFKADEALQRAKRELRELGLSEREGRFERSGQQVAKLAVDGATLKAAIVKRPGRSPEWTEKTLRDAAAVRDFVAELKKKLATWTDRDD
ncbi:MAG: hypothetical protein IPG57_12040 [Burkholderiales bacterium]|jgi:hypothetical protein|uniref:hypothetical protein n=1 Tax=Piscinibacter sp. TaxID=1903157 RepID=UPI001B581B4E|nr:hypothetical protein [Piscinibacter sp.]MBK6715794.1 hypothetical protein [Burkholderiales bacterium]MBK7530530.1 hypothetical protein [Piscinibacter sp.]MBP6544620.1 hypothetical protein [Piscinibacter sp.]